MQVQDFKGSQKLVAIVDEAVGLSSEKALTEHIKNGLCRLIRDGKLGMPECICTPVDGHYARRLLYRSEEHGYSMVAMTWGPGQGTPLHDHAGLWCVEAVCVGSIRVRQYDLVEKQDDRYRFSREDDIEAGVGTAGCLIPPHEYHTIHNAREDDCAVTLHIYGGEMHCCNAFEPQGEGWFKRTQKNLVFDAA